MNPEGSPPRASHSDTASVSCCTLRDVCGGPSAALDRLVDAPAEIGEGQPQNYVFIQTSWKPKTRYSLDACLIYITTTELAGSADRYTAYPSGYRVGSLAKAQPRVTRWTPDCAFVRYGARNAPSYFIELAICE